jgi:hypothetical protein
MSDVNVRPQKRLTFFKNVRYFRGVTLTSDILIILSFTSFYYNCIKYTHSSNSGRGRHEPCVLFDSLGGLPEQSRFQQRSQGRQHHHRAKPELRQGLIAQESRAARAEMLQRRRRRIRGGPCNASLKKGPEDVK